MAMTTSSTSPKIAISPSNSFLAVAATSNTVPSIQCYDLPSCSPAFTLLPPKHSTIRELENGSSKEDLDTHDFFRNQDEQSISKLVLCGKKNNIDDLNHSQDNDPPTHLISHHVFISSNANSSDIISNESNDALLVWDAKTSQLLHKIQTPQDTILNDFVSSSFNNKVLLFALVYIPLIQKYQVLEYDVQTGKLLRKIRAGSGFNDSLPSASGKLSCSDDGRVLAVKTSEQNGDIKILERSSGKRIAKISLYDSDNGHFDSTTNGYQHSSSLMMRFTPAADFLLVCHSDNILNVYPISSKKQSKKSSKSRKSNEKITLLLDSHVRQRTSVVHMDMICFNNHLSVLVTCADGTVHLFHNIKASENNNESSDNIIASVTSTIQVGHRKSSVYKNGSSQLASFGDVRRTTEMIFAASFADAQNLLLVITAGGVDSEDGYSKVMSQSMSFQNSQAQCSLKEEECISIRSLTANGNSRVASSQENGGSGLKRKHEDPITVESKVLGPDKSGGECHLMESMEQIKKEVTFKKMKLETNEDRDKAEIKDEKISQDSEDSAPRMLLSILNQEEERPLFRINMNDRIKGLRQHFHEVHALPAISNTAYKTYANRWKRKPQKAKKRKRGKKGKKENTSTAVKEIDSNDACEEIQPSSTTDVVIVDNSTIAQQIQSLQSGLNKLNMPDRVQTLVGLLIQALADDINASNPEQNKGNRQKYTTCGSPTTLEIIVTELDDKSLISETVSHLQLRQELFLPLLDRVLYMSQNFPQVGKSPVALRTQFSFWIKRLLMECMYKDQKEAHDLLTAVKKMMKGRLGNSKSLYLLEGRIGHLTDSLIEEKEEGAIDKFD